MTARERIADFLGRIQWRGVMAGTRAKPVGRETAELRFWTEDTEHPGERWDVQVTVRLPAKETEQQWSRRLLLALADALAHELGEAVVLDGAPLASPHSRPRLWPWVSRETEEDVA